MSNNVIKKFYESYKETLKLFSDSISQGCNDIDVIFSILSDDELTEEQVCFILNPKYDEYQMTAIRDAFVDGITVEQLQLFDNERINSDFIYEIISMIKEGIDINIIKLINNIDKRDMDVFCYCLNENKDNELLYKYLKPDTDSKLIMKILYRIDDGFNENELDIIIDQGITLSLSVLQKLVDTITDYNFIEKYYDLLLEKGFEEEELNNINKK